MRVVGLLSLVGLLGACSGAASHPSILLVTVDTLRADALGVYGNAKARTPHLDGLAADGLRFTRVATVCPLTLPAHVSLLTGLLPPQHGFRDNDPPAPLPPAEERSFRTLAERLKEAGYATAAFVSSSVLSGRTGIDAGFDAYDEPPPTEPGALRFNERRGAQTIRRTLDWLREAPRPFFVWVHLFDPHEPYEAPAAFRTAPLHTTGAYADEVAYSDDCVGRLLDAIDARDPDTLVVVTADHGEGLGQHAEPTHGYLLFETTLHVPLLVRWPGRVPAGEERTPRASLADVAPTLLGAAGLDPEPGVRSRSLLDGAPDDPVCAESLYGWRHMGWAQLTATWEGNEKLVRGHRDEVYDLGRDPTEVGPRFQAPPALAAVLEGYRALPSLLVGERDESLTALAGGAYLAGVGRNRLDLLPPEENQALPGPDPELAAQIDRVKARIGQAPADSVEKDLLALAGRDPGNPTIEFWRGRNQERAGAWGPAAEAYSRAWDRGLREAKVLSLWLKCLLSAERIGEAGEVIRAHASEVVPTSGLYVFIGAYHLASGNLSEASRYADLAESLARSPRDREFVSSFRHNLGKAKEK